jgi:hypothetical protein
MDRVYESLAEKNQKGGGFDVDGDKPDRGKNSKSMSTPKGEEDNIGNFLHIYSEGKSDRSKLAEAQFAEVKRCNQAKEGIEERMMHLKEEEANQKKRQLDFEIMQFHANEKNKKHYNLMRYVI